MTVREEVLRAAQSLTERGQRLFSPVELIDEARRLGSTGPDSSLRTHTVSMMCANAPGGTGTEELLRVSRGLYKLNPSAEARRTVRVFAGPRVSPTSGTARPTQPVVTTERAWYWEGNIQACVVSHLAMSGWSITRVADTSSKEHGYDIDARRDDTRIIVEVKGYPSTIRSQGDSAGEAKSPGALASQARSYIGGAVLTGILMRAENPEARVVIAFPSVTTFMNLATRIRGVLAKIGVELWTIAEDRTVTELVAATPETAAKDS